MIFLILNPTKKNDETVFLYVASNDPHKNHSNLLKAWVHLSLENCFPKLILTIDQQTNLYNEIIRLKKQHKLNIEIKSNLDRQELFQLYRNVNLLIYPSIFESYAMPLASFYGRFTSNLLRIRFCKRYH